MGLETLPTPSATDLRKLMPCLMKSTVESRQQARDVVKQILSRFPDYGKAPPEYLIGLIEVVEQFPAHVQAAMLDPLSGISARCKFLPTSHDFVSMAAEILSANERETAERARIADLAARVEARRSLPLPPLGKAPVRYYAPNGDEISAKEAAERLARHEQNKANEAKLERRRLYALELGEGDIERGELVMIERGLSEVPADWTPSSEARAA